MVRHGPPSRIARIGMLLPTALALALVLLAAAPVHIPGYASVAPSLGLMAVFFWALRRPELMPNSAAFAAGLLQDLVIGVPLGVFSLAFLVARAVTVDTRGAVLAGGPWFAWLAFALVGGAAMVLAWALIAILSGALPTAPAVIAAVVLPAIVFPLVAWPMARLERLVGVPEWGI